MCDPKYLVSAEQLQCGGINPAYKYDTSGSCVTQDFQKQVMLRKKGERYDIDVKMRICSWNIRSLLALNVLPVIGSNPMHPLLK